MDDIKSYVNGDGKIVFPFYGFDDFEDYYIVANIIKDLSPQDLQYKIGGVFDTIYGHFIINNTIYQLDLPDMLDVEISITKENYNPEKYNKYYTLVNFIWKKSCEVKFGTTR